MTSGNGLSVSYTAFNKPATITRGTASVAFDHDPEHQRYAQTSLSGVTLYIPGSRAMRRTLLAERRIGQISRKSTRCQEPNRKIKPLSHNVNVYMQNEGEA
jgi:hypothetical protein